MIGYEDLLRNDLSGGALNHTHWPRDSDDIERLSYAGWRWRLAVSRRTTTGQASTTLTGVCRGTAARRRRWQASGEARDPLPPLARQVPDPCVTWRRRCSVSRRHSSTSLSTRISIGLQTGAGQACTTSCTLHRRVYERGVVLRRRRGSHRNISRF